MTLIQRYDIFDRNIRRTHGLIDAACRISRLPDPRVATEDLSSEGQDIVRAAVVFLHASLESFLRGLKAYKGRPRGQDTYNDRGQVERLLKKLGVNYQEQERYLPSIDSMMDRRHDIVHRADLPAGETEPKRITFEDSRKSICWFFDVDFFVTEIVLSDADADPLDRHRLVEKLEVKKEMRRQREARPPEGS